MTWIEKAIKVVKFLAAIAPHVNEIFELIKDLVDDDDENDEEAHRKLSEVVDQMK